ncbi:S41 family peptidase [Rivibacter subsaxonicus]|uniref:PDZ domain-containing protein n=1 Tax=Rivibacter subsaxonicus TaxID=457575 RepID=A0A4Q7VVZ2_9BURK|nr:S41 family peptidase [Rivibacter subsaxonicus]RZU00862.1 PDZ domain-containing protein [Rivibacter subsaxonicus]
MKNRNPLRATLAVAFFLMLAGCGGGSDAPATAQRAAPLVAAQAQQCSPNNPHRVDAAAATTLGTLADEKRWVRAYLDAAYLWYREIGNVDSTAAAYSVDTQAGVPDSIASYFEALLTPATTASGKRKDQFSFTYPTKAWKELTQSGVSLGYGIEWSMGSPTPPRNIRIAFVEPGSPAAVAGLQRGDTLLSVNGVSADDGSSYGVGVLNEAVFGPRAGQNYQFRFGRQGAPEVYALLAGTEITRRPVLLTKVLEVDGQKVGYIVFNDHIVPAEAQLIAAIEELRAAGISDLVLDLRYNGGGYLYIASELAYMIAGPTRVAGRPFERLQYNDKRTADTADGDTPFYAKACLPDANFRCSTSQPLPTLDLARVYVLAGGSTCSASESIVNGLRGVDVDVRLIGGSTCGKPYGFTARDNCGISYFPIEFQGVNAKGFGDYADGFGAQCAAADDMNHALGDPAEGRLAAALHLRSTGSCPPVPATPLSVRPKAGTSEPRLVRGPTRENRFLVPLQR